MFGRLSCLAIQRGIAQFDWSQKGQGRVRAWCSTERRQLKQVEIIIPLCCFAGWSVSGSHIIIHHALHRPNSQTSNNTSVTLPCEWTSIERDRKISSFKPSPAFFIEGSQTLRTSDTRPLSGRCDNITMLAVTIHSHQITIGKICRPLSNIRSLSGQCDHRTRHVPGSEHIMSLSERMPVYNHISTDSITTLLQR
jgi:hypothetical protein